MLPKLVLTPAISPAVAIRQGVYYLWQNDDRSEAQYGSYQNPTEIYLYRSIQAWGCSAVTTALNMENNW